jgi:hypothetical protein
MNSTIAAPVDWVEAVGNLRFPSKADRRLQALIDQNSERFLQESEREEPEALVELSSRRTHHPTRQGRALRVGMGRSQ